MNDQEIQFTPLTWWLVIAWVIFSVVMFVVGWSWIATNARKYRPGSALAKTILIRGIPLVFTHLIWATFVLLTTSIKRENLLCLWIGAPMVFGFAYLSLHAALRRLRRMEEAEPRRDTMKGQEKT